MAHFGVAQTRHPVVTATLIAATTATPVNCLDDGTATSCSTTIAGASRAASAAGVCSRCQSKRVEALLH